jgi:hypothetical protein
MRKMQVTAAGASLHISLAANSAVQSPTNIKTDVTKDKLEHKSSAPATGISVFGITKSAIALKFSRRHGLALLQCKKHSWCCGLNIMRDKTIRTSVFIL